MTRRLPDRLQNKLARTLPDYERRYGGHNALSCRLLEGFPDVVPYGRLRMAWPPAGSTLDGRLAASAVPA